MARPQGEITKRGTIDVLRHGVKHGAHDLELLYGTPSPGNQHAAERFEQNRFTVVRQLRYSRDETQRALDIGLFSNISWQDGDRVAELITKTIPAQVARDSAFRNARQNSNEANARIEHDKALERVVMRMVNDDAELFKQFVDNKEFRRWMTARVFELACKAGPADSN